MTETKIPTVRVFVSSPGDVLPERDRDQRSALPPVVKAMLPTMQTYIDGLP